MFMSRPAVALIAFCCMIVGCGGDGGAPALDEVLPEKLGDATLRREQFTGTGWLAAGTEQFVQPELRLDVGRFLALLDREPSDLTVAWHSRRTGRK